MPDDAGLVIELALSLYGVEGVDGVVVVVAGSGGTCGAACAYAAVANDATTRDAKAVAMRVFMGDSLSG
jgi:hypothetical protein